MRGVSGAALPFRILHFTTDFILPLFQSGPDFQSAPGGGFPDEADDDLPRGQRPSPQFRLMLENIRCSILVHLLVPGGR